LDRHTARGDVAWAIAQYDAVVGESAVQLPAVARNDPRRADLVELRARQLLAHGLAQREHGNDGLGDAIDATLADSTRPARSPARSVSC
jgi:hypothetical protein